MRLPNFLGVGPPRTATTWLNQCLKDHPEVYTPTSIKEVRYFCRNYSKSVEWYAQHFADADGEIAFGEISPTYFLVDPRRVADLIPDAKIIVTLRDPSERAWSAYCKQLVQVKIKGGDLYDAFSGNLIKADGRPSQILEWGLYSKYLPQWTKRFDTLVLLHDDIERDPASCLSSVFAHLGADPAYLPSTIERRVNTGQSSHVVRWIYRLSQIGGRRGKRFASRLRRRYASPRPDLPADLRGKLVEYYRPDMDRLEEMLGRDLSAWKRHSIAPPITYDTDVDAGHVVATPLSG